MLERHGVEPLARIVTGSLTRHSEVLAKLRTDLRLIELRAQCARTAKQREDVAFDAKVLKVRIRSAKESGEVLRRIHSRLHA